MKLQTCLVNQKNPHEVSTIIKNILSFLFFYFSPLVVYKIQGKSMEPAFKEGQKILVQKKWFFCKINVCDVVVLKDPRNGKEIVKKIAGMWEVGGGNVEKDVRIWKMESIPSPTSKFSLLPLTSYIKYYVLGDNPSQSTDSREFGWIKRKEIIGKVIR